MINNVVFVSGVQQSDSVIHIHVSILFQMGICIFKSKTGRTSLVVQWLRLLAPNAGGLSSVPGQGTRSCMLQLKRSCVLQLRPGTAK